MKSIIFGIGNDYKKNKIFIEDEIVGYVDNYNAGKKMPDGKTIVAADDIEKLQFDRIIVASSKYRSEMLKQLWAIDEGYLERTILLNELDKRSVFKKLYYGKLLGYPRYENNVKVKRYYIVVPLDSVSGGPELLHQLAYNLKNLLKDQEVYLAYYAQNKEKINYYKKYPQSMVPEEYKGYVEDCNVITTDDIVDYPDSILIVPEVIPEMILKIKNARVFMWWLSVDNFFKTIDISMVVDLFNKIELHIYQSEYAKSFLEDIGISEEKMFGLSDYINEGFVLNSPEKKEDVIAYNPKKGFNFSFVIINKLKNYRFIPIENMNNSQVRELLAHSKVYIDFGNHPGKDRLPREAAIMNCCVICGKRGSAENEIDVPIDSKYKISVNNGEWVIEAKNIIEDCMNNYDYHNQAFEKYRKIISNEKKLFLERVTALIDCEKRYY